MQRLTAVVLCLVLLAQVSGCTGEAACAVALQNTSYSYKAEVDIQIDSWQTYDEAYLLALRTAYGLDGLTTAAETDFDKVQAIASWVTNLWAHDGWNEPAQSDPLFILDEVTKNGQQFRCVEYGTVIVGCLQALGIPVRQLGLKTADVETREFGAGHVVAEVFLREYNKWVLVDGQTGMIPLLDGVPLNGVELAQALQSNRTALDAILLQPQYTKEVCFSFIQEYLFFFDFTYMQEGTARRVMLVPFGVANPTVFQRHYDLDVDVYTHSALDFYPVPGKE